ncbi:hypothetical protein [Hespellia stercorisuis]|uniref:Uncharacterized protein n=1 Tax=Hespellia stercorisuis DSM 15480 TaxID=1121950 RepID=A0A1M6RLP0_9FIRM|nr:hypothetical protein [Hespellia stercorisuis]SHK33372.1 hypothetical protein SAMN02745243_02727 [Hespellia stercorisuis DSM 15480]
MKILRAFQVINRDGTKTVSATYNEVDENGNIIKENAKDSFYAVDATLTNHLTAIEDYINSRMEG